ncbi:MAG: AraC family transcriptional regulator [Azospirillaceae bacterium]|nr:AraC family transcriptional regulator [Azospirillaceae bacterium]
MPAIPVPFVAALVLVGLLAFMAVRRDDSADSAAMILVGACAVVAIAVGLRWRFDLPALRRVQPIVAAALPALAWLCFTGLVRGLVRRGRAARWLGRRHAAPIIVVAILTGTWKGPIAGILVGLSLGYGLALLRLARQGPDAFAATRLDAASGACRATAIAGLMLIGSGLVALIAALRTGGADAAPILACVNLIAVLGLAGAAAGAGRARPVAPDADPDADPGADPDPDADADSGPAGPEPPATAAVAAASRPLEPADTVIIATVDRLIRDRALFQDPDLTLNRLARRAGIPARQISTAINRVQGCNVSQMVNAYRIAEARRLLAETDMPVTTVMFESGFQTKSNFNREFRRVTGMSPREFRRSPDGVNPIAGSAPGTG